MDDADTAVEGVIGREQELVAVSDFLNGAPPPALLITGPAGIGKTTLWEATVAAARERDFAVLTARPSEAESELSFAALNDLLDGVDDALTEQLPAAQRRALDVALARAEPIGAPPEPLAIATGLLGIFRDEALGGRVLIAVDDAQWLDRASAAALVFACRRGLSERVRLLVAVRPGLEAQIEREVACRRLELGSITLVQARELIHRQLGLSVPRPLMTRIVEAADGNPLVVLELGRLLLERGTLELGAEPPLPELAGQLFGARVRELPEPVADALLAASLSAQLTRAELAAAVGPSAVAEAAAYGVLAVERDRVRAANPLLATAAREYATEEQRGAVHLRLSRALAGQERAARHLALATTGADPDRAAVVAAAAVAARRRGASRDAADLAEHAARLTPDGDPAEVDRLLTFGEYLMSAGEINRLRALLEAGIGELPPGAPRARAHKLLADCSDQAGHEEHLERAIEESHDHPGLRAAALASKVMLHVVLLVERLADAQLWAEEGVAAARAADPPDPVAERQALSALAWARAMRGLPVQELAEQFDAVDYGASIYEASVDRVVGVRHGFRGELDDAQRAFERLVEIADERGESISGEVMRLHQCEIALRAGDCESVRRRLDDWDTWATLEEVLPSRLRCGTLLVAIAGDAERARELAAETLEMPLVTIWDRLEVSRALGIAAIFDRSAEAAVGHLEGVWEHTQREGVDELGAFPVAAELTQALIEVGRADDGARVAARVRELAEPQDHPWGKATAARCESLVALASAWDDAAAAALSEAAHAYRAHGLGFEHARTLLSLGSGARRHRKWGRARDALDAAAAAFDELGCAGWAAQARSELDRVGARRPAAQGELTSAEARVVALAADGMSNKQIAAELVVTVHTVEVHLSRAYAKLGVRSRSQLAQALAAPE